MQLVHSFCIGGLIVDTPTRIDQPMHRSFRCTGMSADSKPYDGPDRRASGKPQERRDSVVDRRSGMDRRRGPGRRRGEVRRAAEEGEISGELLEFIMAIDEYKRVNDRPFPSWSEVFEIIHYLGYRKVEKRSSHINDASGREVLESSAAT